MSVYIYLQVACPAPQLRQDHDQLCDVQILQSWRRTSSCTDVPQCHDSATVTVNWGAPAALKSRSQGVERPVQGCCRPET